jgi:tetratricopeptide (TPR) repeat protein
MLEDLVQTLERPEPSVSSRMRYLFSTWFPPAATLKKELGEALVSLGMVGAALDLFEEVELWDSLIVCLSLLGKKQQAADLVRRRLDADDTNPKLWCALGDALDDEKYYWKAWEVSGERNARAKRSLARRAAAREDWPTAAEHWMSALTINPLFPDGWFSGGYACLKCNRVEDALAAFVRCTQIDAENGQAWNNVAALSIRMSRFTAAHTALCEAVKHQRNSWHTWENHAMVCAKVGKFATSALSLIKVLELTQGARVHIETMQTLLERVREARENPTGAKWVIDAANWEEEAASQMDEEEESWADTAMGDLAADMLSAFSGIDLPTISYAAKPESVHPSGMPRVALQLEAAFGQVLDRAALGSSAGERKMRDTSQIWAIMAQYKSILGEYEDASDARLKCVRALETSGWRNDLEPYEDYAAATKIMVEGLLSDIAAGRGGSAESIRLHLKSVVKVGEKNGYEGTEAYADISGLLTKISLLSA